MSDNWWEVCVDETRVWCDVEDCSWGCVSFDWFLNGTLVIPKQINKPTDKTYH